MEYVNLTVVDTLGVEHAEVRVNAGEVIEVVGPNASGKTSLATCAQAVLTHELNPLGLPAAETKRNYPKDQSEDSRVELVHWQPVEDDEFGITEIDTELVWLPHSQQFIMPPDTEPLSSPAAVGLIDWRPRKTPKERAIALQAALLPPPEVVLAQVREAIAPYIDPKDLDGVMEMLKADDWKGALDAYELRRKKAKKQWEDITHANYGVRVAADWLPDGWHPDWEQLTPLQADENVAAARDAAELLRLDHHLSEDEASKAEEARAQIPDLEDRQAQTAAAVTAQMGEIEAVGLGPATMNLREANTHLQTVTAALNQVKRDHGKALRCPGCETALLYDGDKLVHFDDDAAAKQLADVEGQVAEAQKIVDAAADVREAKEAKVEELRGVLETLTGADRHAQDALRDARRAADRTGEIDTAERRQQVANAEQALEEAKECATAVRRRNDAAKQHESVVRYDDVVKALGPQGVRARLLEDGLVRTNRRLAQLAQIADWPEVTIADNASLKWGERPLALCSESEQWRAQACVQIVLASLTDARFVVLDRADLLDPANRVKLVRGLGRAAAGAGIGVLLCSTGEPLPDAPWPQTVIADGRIN